MRVGFIRSDDEAEPIGLDGIESLSLDEAVAARDRFDVLIAPAVMIPWLRAEMGKRIRFIGLLEESISPNRVVVEAADALVTADQITAVIGNGVTPVTAVVSLPLEYVASVISSAAFREVLDLAREQREMPLILANSILVDDGETLIVVVADGDDTYARNSADDLAMALWERRDRIAAEMAEQRRPSRPRVPLDALAAWEPGREDGVWFGVRRGLSRA